MIVKLLSGDTPRSRLLSVCLAAILLSLAFAPFLFPGIRAIDTAIHICIFIVLAASYDLLLGYGGIVSFAHAMFFGIGAYGVAQAHTLLDRSLGSLAIGMTAGVVVAAILALAIGLLSLRVRAIFFAMITLAFATVSSVLVVQFSDLTGGEDGLTFQTSRLFSPATRIADFDVLGVRMDGRLVCYYFIFVTSLCLFLGMLRIVNSPFGRVLESVRENDSRAASLGYQVVVYRVTASCVAAMAAALAGSLYAVWLRYVGPSTVVSFDVMLDILLMVVIGGMGTLYGAVLGATLLILAQSYLKALMGAVVGTNLNAHWIENLVDPDRWLLWLGLSFILCVYFFPKGIVGRLRQAVDNGHR